MRILGVDPGIATTGFGVVEYDGKRSILVDYGSIRTSPSRCGAARLGVIYSELLQIIARNGPGEVAVEKLFFNRNTTSAMQVGEARGVVILAASHAGLPVYEYTPLQVKQAVVGYGRAEKLQIQQMVRILLSLAAVPSPDDAADALALALCHGQSRKLKAVLERGEKNV